MADALKRQLDASPEVVREALSEAAEMWSAAWQAEPAGGRLHLPVLAGVRRGQVLARVEVEETPAGSEMRLEVEREEYAVNHSAVLFLSLGALGALSLILWPLAPARIAGFVPLGLVFMIGAWLLVASRLRTAGPEDFLETVAELAEYEEPPPERDRA